MTLLSLIFDSLLLLVSFHCVNRKVGRKKCAQMFLCSVTQLTHTTVHATESKEKRKE
jgi:hypothetical protein